jgi:hypothetical protein
MDHIRTKYSIKTLNYSDDLVQQLSDKSLVEKAEIKKLFNLFNLVNTSNAIRPDTLIELNNLIEKFYLKTGIYGK